MGASQVVEVVGRAGLPDAPAHLSADAAGWWNQIVSSFELEPHHLRLLQLASEAWDEAQAARAVVAEEGVMVEDRFGQARAHPAHKVLQDASIRFSRFLRELGLDAATEPSRGPRLY